MFLFCFFPFRTQYLLTNSLENISFADVSTNAVNVPIDPYLSDISATLIELFPLHLNYNEPQPEPEPESEPEPEPEPQPEPEPEPEPEGDMDAVRYIKII